MNEEEFLLWAKKRNKKFQERIDREVRKIIKKFGLKVDPEEFKPNPQHTVMCLKFICTCHVGKNA